MTTSDKRQELRTKIGAELRWVKERIEMILDDRREDKEISIYKNYFDKIKNILNVTVTDDEITEAELKWFDFDVKEHQLKFADQFLDNFQQLIEFFKNKGRLRDCQVKTIIHIFLLHEFRHVSQGVERTNYKQLKRYAPTALRLMDYDADAAAIISCYYLYSYNDNSGENYWNSLSTDSGTLRTEGWKNQIKYLIESSILSMRIFDFQEINKNHVGSIKIDYKRFIRYFTWALQYIRVQRFSKTNSQNCIESLGLHITPIVEIFWDDENRPFMDSRFEAQYNPETISLDFLNLRRTGTISIYWKNEIFYPHPISSSQGDTSNIFEDIVNCEFSKSIYALSGIIQGFNAFVSPVITDFSINIQEDANQEAINIQEDANQEAINIQPISISIELTSVSSSITFTLISKQTYYSADFGDDTIFNLARTIESYGNRGYVHLDDAEFYGREIARLIVERFNKEQLTNQSYINEQQEPLGNSLYIPVIVEYAGINCILIRYIENANQWEANTELELLSGTTPARFIILSTETKPLPSRASQSPAGG